MPVRSLGGGRYQWGHHGKIYHGKNAKARATRQGRAIFASGYNKSTNLFLDWMMKEKCPEGNHIHPGRMYCHPEERTHPKINVSGPHPGMKEIDTSKIKKPDPFIFSDLEVEKRFWESEEKYDLMTQIATVTGSWNQYEIKSFTDDTIIVALPNKEIFEWNYTLFDKPEKLVPITDVFFPKTLKDYLSSKGLVSDFKFVDDTEEKTRWINKSKKIALIHDKENNTWVYIPAFSTFENIIIITDDELNLLQPVATQVIENTNLPWDDRLERIEKSKGSHPGGIYKDKVTGEQYYIKNMPGDHIAAEELASKLYGLGGVPHISAFKIHFQNHDAIASKFLSNTHYPTYTDLQNQEAILNNFVFDAWLANWDVAGVDFSNIIMDSEKTTPYRIDFGGALNFRALGGTKSFKANVEELDTMRDTDKNPAAAKLFENLTKEHLKTGAKILSKISDQEITDVVNASAISSKAPFSQLLIKRRDYIVNKILTTSEKAVAITEGCNPGFHRHSGYDYCHPAERKHRIEGAAQKIGTNTVYKMLSQHPNQLIREIAKKAYQYKFSDDKEGLKGLEEIRRFSEDNKIDFTSANLIMYLWQKGDNYISLRAALYELQNKADEKYASENAYFVYERGETPSEFARQYKKGQELAPALIPFVIKTQKVLEKKYKNGLILAVYRGIKDQMASKIKRAVQNAKAGDIIAIPHDGSSPYTLNKTVAKNFGHIILKKQHIPINKVLIYLNALYPTPYANEEEIILDSDAVTLFTKDEIEI